MQLLYVYNAIVDNLNVNMSKAGFIDYKLVLVEPELIQI